MGLLDKKKERQLAEKLAKRDARKLEQDANAVLKAFKDRREAEEKRRKLATDSEYWVTICFSSREDKERFVKHFELDQCPLVPGTKGDKYVNGYELIQRWESTPEESLDTVSIAGARPDVPLTSELGESAHDGDDLLGEVGEVAD